MLKPDDVLTLDEVGKILNVCNATIYNWIKLKKLPAKKVGRCWRILKSSVDDYQIGLARKTGPPDENPGKI